MISLDSVARRGNRTYLNAPDPLDDQRLAARLLPDPAEILPAEIWVDIGEHLEVRQISI